MNCIELFIEQSKNRPKEVAIYIPFQEEISFEELLRNATKAQIFYQSLKIHPGDSVLLFDSLSSRLYSSIIALAASGITIILVEPWMPIAQIQSTIRLIKPKIFVSNSIGFIWGARVPAVRDIPQWIASSSIRSKSIDAALKLENVHPDTPAILTFTSGTSGTPKGVIRSHGYLLKQHEIFAKHFESNKFRGPDLCLFANFVLSNLASGRGSVIISPTWKPKILKSLDHLPTKNQPTTLTTGPAFLIQLMKYSQLPTLQLIHMGGALTDCWIFEKGFEHWPKARWSHVYGGSEVEPVALADGYEAVQKSRKQGYFQTLYLGKNVSDILPSMNEKGLWVSGPHVCPEYFGNPVENSLLKRKDAEGILWHCMGDHIAEDPTGNWWYQGRAAQNINHFILEQKIYQRLQSSKSFIHSNWLIGEGVTSQSRELLEEFSELEGVIEAEIFRDRRHRARIDRTKTIENGALWLNG